MPANLTVEYYRAESEFRSAKTREGKIKALENMISACPKHKGTDHLMAELKAKLSKLKKQSIAKVGRGGFSLSKQGDAQVCILGMTQTGKSTLLSMLTNARPKISDIPFTTKKPQVGVIEWKGTIIQLIEIPSTFENIYMSVVQTCDGIVVVYKNQEDLKRIRKVISEFRLRAPIVFVEVKGEIDREKLKGKIWDMIGKVRVYTKEPGKKSENRALVLKKRGTVMDAAKQVHKDFIKFFNFARVWGKSAKYPGQKFGMGHLLKDGDIVEFHMKKK